MIIRRPFFNAPTVAIFIILFVLILIPSGKNPRLGYQQELVLSQDEVKLTIYASTDYFVLYIPENGPSVSLFGLGFQGAVGGRIYVPVEEFEVLSHPQGHNGSGEPGECYVFFSGNQVPLLPSDCKEKSFTQSLSINDKFWINPRGNSVRDISIYRDQRYLESCSALSLIDTTGCVIQWESPPTPTPLTATVTMTPSITPTATITSTPMPPEGMVPVPADRPVFYVHASPVSFHDFKEFAEGENAEGYYVKLPDEVNQPSSVDDKLEPYIRASWYEADIYCREWLPHYLNNTTYTFALMIYREEALSLVATPNFQEWVGLDKTKPNQFPAVRYGENGVPERFFTTPIQPATNKNIGFRCIAWPK